ncbi:restriction endonuclease fold toxin-2 domain-containing protein, partial [Nocardioides sp. NPDC101246]|uniref:restriction endonuclease fold toxin-2 domain-containing protein n=1 Tax=Nocardioides sp. NPDC101246 TaxID=3364336 RepID=UPI003821BC18
TSKMWFVLQLGLIGVLTVLAWRLTRPAAYGIPGLEHFRRAMHQRLAIRQGAQDGVAATARPPAAISGVASAHQAAFIPGYSDRPARATYGYVLPESERPDLLPLPGASDASFVPGLVLGAKDAPARQLGPEKAKPDLRYPGGYASAWPADKRHQWVVRLISDPSNVKPENREGPAYDFQRKHAGPNNVVLRGGGSEINADGLVEDPDKVVTIEAKYVNRPGASNAVNEGRIPAFMKEKIEREFKSEMIRYGRVMNDPSNPIDRLRITVSTAAAGEYWGKLAQEHLGPNADVEIRLESD